MSETIAVVGSTGPLGRALLDHALSQGLRVRALARRPEALELQHPGLTVVRGDVYRPETLAELLEGAGAVVSALGRGTLMQARKPSRVLAEGTANLVAAMRTRRLSRLIAVSSVGVVDDPTEEFVYRHIIKRILSDLYEDMRNMEAIVAQARDLRWTLVRPPLLVTGPPKKSYVTWRGENVPFGYRLPHADLAQFLVSEVSAGRYTNAVVGISNPTRRTPPTPLDAASAAA